LRSTVVVAIPSELARLIFFNITMNKPAYTISDQIALLKQRGMAFRDETQASNLLKNISYYRLKGYWWDAQADPENNIARKKHDFK